MQLLQPRCATVLYTGGTQRAAATKSQSHLCSCRRQRSSDAQCQRLQIVKPPDAVVCLQDGVFQRCYELRTVLVPGCKKFGRSVFAECCSLSQIGAAEDTTNLLAPHAQVSPHAFERCLALRQINFEKTETNPSNCTRYIPQGCFLGSGIDQLDLPADFNFLGPAACEN